MRAAGGVGVGVEGDERFPCQVPSLVPLHSAEGLIVGPPFASCFTFASVVTGLFSDEVRGAGRVSFFVSWTGIFFKDEIEIYYARGRCSGR